MNRKLTLLSLSILGAFMPARAAIIGTVDAGQGTRIELHDGPGELCKAPARMAVYTDAAGSTTAGCWVLRREGVRVNWLDGDADMVPLQAIRKPVEG